VAGGRAGEPTPGVDVEYVDEPPAGRRIGIALSGGGIRSAAFNLGALQALQECEFLESADYLAAVSGGNYIASALTISYARGTPGGDGSEDGGHTYWAHGSPEERYLRRYVNYLAPGYVGRVWLGMSVVFGFLLNYLPFLLGAFVAGQVLGWLTHLTGPLLDVPSRLGLPVSAPLLLTLVPTAGILGSLVLVGARRLRDDLKGVPEYTKRRTEPVVARLVSLTGAVLLLLLLPLLATGFGAASRGLVVLAGRSAEDVDTTTGRIVVTGLWLLLTLALAVLAIMLGGRTRARRVMLVVSAVAGAGLLLVPLLSSLEHAAAYGFSSGLDAVPALVAVLVMLLMAVGVHNRRYSMHTFYRERLNSAFAVERKDDGGNTVAEAIDYSERLDFSALGGAIADHAAPLPKLVVCCAVNVTTADVPVGRFAESFTFEYDRSGGPRFGYGPTARLERSRGLRGTVLTLPSLMAVSGAAISPLMGRFTYPPLRFLMALTNVRLGVWIINPDHPAWQRPPKAPPRNVVQRVVRGVVAGWHEPGAMYVLREAVGGLDLKRRFIYLSDGGHWENLGLVELMRRRCTELVCFDASGSQNGAGQDLGRAIAIARSDLGADVELDPRPTLPGPDGTSAKAAVRGSVTYADGSTGRLVYAPATMTEESSWDLRALRTRDSRFPNHPTAQQIFTDELFEAYRTLGHAAGVKAFEALNIPSAQLHNGRLPTDGLKAASS
jgi:hypothetical protein